MYIPIIYTVGYTAMNIYYILWLLFYRPSIYHKRIKKKEDENLDTITYKFYNRMLYMKNQNKSKNK